MQSIAWHGLCIAGSAGLALLLRSAKGCGAHWPVLAQLARIAIWLGLSLIVCCLTHVLAFLYLFPLLAGNVLQSIHCLLSAIFRERCMPENPKSRGRQTQADFLIS